MAPRTSTSGATPATTTSARSRRLSGAALASTQLARKCVAGDMSQTYHGKGIRSGEADRSLKPWSCADDVVPTALGRKNGVQIRRVGETDIRTVAQHVSAGL